MVWEIWLSESWMYLRKIPKNYFNVERIKNKQAYSRLIIVSRVLKRLWYCLLKWVDQEGKRLFWVMLIKQHLRFQFRFCSLEKKSLLTFHFLMSNSMWQKRKSPTCCTETCLFITVRGKAILNPLEHLPRCIFCLICEQNTSVLLLVA